MTKYEKFLRDLDDEALLDELDKVESTMVYSIFQRGKMSKLQIKQKAQVRAEILSRMSKKEYETG